MLKLLLGIAVIGFCSFCGYLLTKRYRQRKAFFKQLYAFNERFLSEIAYYRRPIKEFIAAYAYQGEFQLLLTDYFSDLDERAPIERILCETAKYDFLKKEELRTVADYFMMLGRGDSASQKGYFSSARDRLSALRSTTDSDAKRYGDLYVKIGFLCGLFILILMI